MVVGSDGVVAAPDLTPQERLGKALFFDEISDPDSMSCADCHAPSAVWTGPIPGIDMHGAVYRGAVPQRFGNRKPPSAAYAASSPIFHYDNPLSDCDGMTKRAVDEYLVGLRPKPVFNPSIRKRPSSKKGSDKARDEGQQKATQEREPAKQPDGCPSAEETPSQRLVEENPDETPPSRSPNLREAARTDVFNFRFSADKNFKEKSERLAEVLGVENPLKNMAEVSERAIDISLEKKDPKKKLERRVKRERKRGASSKKLVRTRWQPRVARHRDQPKKRRPATFLPKCANASTREQASSANSGPRPNAV